MNKKPVDPVLFAKIESYVKNARACAFHAMKLAVRGHRFTAAMEAMLAGMWAETSGYYRMWKPFNSPGSMMEIFVEHIQPGMSDEESARAWEVLARAFYELQSSYESGIEASMNARGGNVTDQSAVLAPEERDSESVTK